MRLKRSNAGPRACALVSLIVLSAMALTAAPALALPKGRGYEMVSPVYKGGYGVGGLVAVAANGERAVYGSEGAFANVDKREIEENYLASRTPSGGWVTVPLMVPNALAPYNFPNDFSQTLGTTLSLGALGPDKGTTTRESHDGYEFLLHNNALPDTNENWAVFGGVNLKLTDEKHFEPKEEGASANLCHVIVGQVGSLIEEAESTNSQIYDLSNGCEGKSASLRLIGLDNGGKPFAAECTYLGSDLGNESAFGAISNSGEEIFFTATLRGQGCGSLASQVFVRLDEERTLEISRPLDPNAPFGGCGEAGEVPCPNADARAPSTFQGASENGSRVFFTTTEPLVESDKDKSTDLYMAVIGCMGSEGCPTREKEVLSLTQVSDGHEPAEVQGVVRVAPDGSRVYFVAHGIISNNSNEQGLAPTAGADNLYVYDVESKELTFIDDLCSGPKLSGFASDLACPTDLVQGAGERNDTRLWLGQGEAQTGSKDGRYLVFATYGQLVSGDTDNAKDIYRYNAVNGELERVSVGEEGYDAIGNATDKPSESNADATINEGHVGDEGAKITAQYELRTRAISEDGSRIVFKSPEPLSPEATNGLVNAYEWHEGIVSLISTGSDEEPVTEAVISPSGNDLFFVTVQGLVAKDTDGAADLYDARLGGGEPPPLVQQQPCSGDACQGPLTDPGPLLVPGSISQTPGDNFAGAPATVNQLPARLKKKTLRGKKATKAKKKRAARRAGVGRRLGQKGARR